MSLTENQNLGGKIENPNTILVKFKVSKGIANELLRLGVRQEFGKVTTKEAIRITEMRKEGMTNTELATKIRRDAIEPEIMHFDTGLQVLKGDNADLNTCSLIFDLLETQIYVCTDTHLYNKSEFKNNPNWELIIAFENIHTTNVPKEEWRNEDQVFKGDIGDIIAKVSCRVWIHLHIWENAKESSHTINCAKSKEEKDETSKGFITAKLDVKGSLRYIIKGN